MSLFNTLNTGASGMTVSGTGLAVIGDNIANLSSTGYKRSQANFADAFPNSVGTLSGIQKLGRGAVTSTIATTFEQGMLQGTGSALDVALTGVGFFQVANGPDNYYTRDGHFMLDKEGWMVNSQGLNVQGYNAQNGLVSSVVSDIQIDMGPFPPQATETITLDAQLKPLNNFSPLDIEYQPIQGQLDGTQITMEEAADLADYSTSITVYDSLGRPHDVVINFEQIDSDGATGETSWIYSAVIDGGEADLGGGVNGTDGMALEIATGALVFDADGNLTQNFPSPDPNAGWVWPAAQPYVFDWEIGLDAAGNPTDGSLLSVGGRETDDDIGGVVSAIQQDGYTVGDLTNISVDGDGIIRGQYTNGEDRVLAQLAVATFAAEGGLERMGGNLYKATLTSGDPALAAAGQGIRGTTSGYTLERSNVDLEDEFVAMIQAQRSYQANAGVIRTADENLQQLVNLV